MFLSRAESYAVAEKARSYGIDGEPERLVADALQAICSGNAERAAYDVATAGGVEFIGDFIWYKETPLMNAEKAREILVQAKSDNTYEGPVPQDDEKAIDEARGLVNMAQEAWDANARGQEVERILRLANEDFSGNGNGASGNSQSEESPLPTEEVKQELADIEPWENYKTDKVSDIIDGINAAVEDKLEDLDELLAHVWGYESAHKNRKGVIERLEAVAAERSPGEEESSPASSGEGSEEDPAASEDGAGDQARAEGSEDGGAEVQASDREPEPDATDEPGAEAASASAEDRAGADEASPPAQDRASSHLEHEDLVAAIEANLRSELLHVPAKIEIEPPEVPFDLTTLTDRQLQFFYGAFASYAYRANYLLLREEATARRYKEMADELHKELLIRADKEDPQTGKPKTVTMLEAEIETDHNVRTWRRQQRKHEAFADSYRRERDSYNKYVESLSRLETMRDNEWIRSGGKKNR